MILLEKTKSPRSKAIAIILIILLLLGGLVLFAYNYFKQIQEPISLTDSSDIAVEVLAGSSTDKIATLLYNKGLIHNKLIFKYKVKEMDLETSLKAGSYNLKKTMDIEEIIHSLNKGVKSKDTVRFTIPEGYELDQLASKLSNEGLVDYERFIYLTINKSNFEDRYPFLKELEDNFNSLMQKAFKGELF